MNKLIALIFVVTALSMISCSDQQSLHEIQSLKKELQANEQERSLLKNQLNSQKQRQGNWVHYVFLDIKSDISEKQYQFLIGEIKTLAKINGVKDLEIGRNEDMGDDRSIVDRDINFEMRFEKKMDYYSYQKSEEHIRVRKLLSPFLENAPLTYDYIVQ